MWKRISGIIVSPQTLESPPDPWNGGEETEKPRVGRIALYWVVPIPGVETKEKLDVLGEY